MAAGHRSSLRKAPACRTSTDGPLNTTASPAACTQVHLANALLRNIQKRLVCGGTHSQKTTDNGRPCGVVRAPGHSGVRTPRMGDTGTHPGTVVLAHQECVKSWGVELVARWAAGLQQVLGRRPSAGCHRGDASRVQARGGSSNSLCGVVGSTTDAVGPAGRRRARARVQASPRPAGWWQLYVRHQRLTTAPAACRPDSLLNLTGCWV